ncbi:integrase [Paraburkholderia sediminicola]|uniref:integrase n=1 Tax=Paraburkholderia sediminicola TaxID=458836 RepID=UPI0038BAD53A
MAFARPLEAAGAFQFTWQKVSDETVVARNASGEPCSWFRDDSWNVAAYGKNVRNRNIHFRGLVDAGTDATITLFTRAQTKQVMYFLMHHASDTVPAPLTLKQHMVHLRAVAKFAANRSLSLYEALSNSNVALDYIQSVEPPKAQRLHAILVHLHRLGETETGVQIPLRALHGPMLDRFAEREDSRQHPVIPTRIYQHFLSACESHLGQLEAALPHLESLLEAAYEDGPLAPTPEALSILNVYGFGIACTRQDLSGLLTQIGRFCQLVILAFTGMRAMEAESLPFNCLKVLRVDGVEHFTIEGITTKLTKGRVKRASWVTSTLGARAVQLAQALFAPAHRHFGSAGWDTATDGSHLLICRHGLMAAYDASRGPAGQDAVPEGLRDRLILTITAEDIVELKRIDPFRAWDEETKFAVGEPWPFTRHQLRRSLALYAHRSGIVTLPTLKRQLQHLTTEMSMYYARGSAFARDLLDGDETHFAHEWNEAAGLSEYLGYAAEVLFSDEKLFGGHVAWAQSNAVVESPVSVYSRAQTVEMFEKGQLSYADTPLGGCASTEPCKASPLNWLNVECLEKDCKNLVVVPSKLERVIKAQQRRVERLKGTAEGSVEHRMESDVLATLLAAQSKHSQRTKT